MIELYKNITVLHRDSPYHLQKVDLLVSNGIIEEIGQNLKSEKAEIIEGNELHVSAGLCDIGTFSGEPGNEQRETIDSLTRSALKGGYTALCIMPGNVPATQTRGDILYFVNHPFTNKVTLYPLGSLSKDNEGVEISEFHEMNSVGTRVFCDGLKTIQNSGLMNKALQYSSGFGGAILHHPCDKYLSMGSEMNEGHTSTLLGLKGEPDIAELNILNRDLLLNAYNNSNIIIHAISSEKSIEMILKSKIEGNKVSSTVSYKNLIFTDQDLHDFNSNLKLRPVLRTESDRKALYQAVINGNIEAVISNHAPLEKELKNLEFPYVTPGATGLETCLPATLSLAKTKDELEKLIHALTLGPRNIMGLEIPRIEKGEKANLCVFDAYDPWIYNVNDRGSKSSNTPFHDKKFNVKVIRTIIG